MTVNLRSSNVTNQLWLGFVVCIFVSCSSPQPTSTTTPKSASAKPATIAAKAKEPEKNPEKKLAFAAQCFGQDQCDGLCRILYGNEGGYCSIFCTNASECPGEWTCDTDVGMNNETFCRKPDEVQPIDVFASPKEKGEWIIEFVIKQKTFTEECRVVFIGGEVYGGCRETGGKWGGDAFDFFGRSSYSHQPVYDTARQRFVDNVKKMFSSSSPKIKNAVKRSFIEMFKKEGERERYSSVNIADNLKQIKITKYEGSLPVKRRQKK